MNDIEIVCILDDDDIRRCFSIAVDRTLMPVCHDTNTLPADDSAWYLELVKQLELDNSSAPIIKDWS